jgi:signal transduction histidine kinase
MSLIALSRQQLGAAWRRLGRLLKHDLRVRVALGVGLPILLALAGLSLLHYWRERGLLEAQARLTAQQIGQVVGGGLQHAMLAHDAGMLSDVLAGVGRQQSIERAQIVDLDGNVLVESGFDRDGHVQHVAEPGCNACHRLSPDRRPAAAVVSADVELIRVAVPIYNEPECQVCHAADGRHLGVLMLDVPMRVLGPLTVANLRTDLALSIALAVGMALSLYWLLHRLVVRRVAAFRRPLAAYAAGDFGVRLAPGKSADEIDQLAVTFNRMADQLAAHRREELARGELRQRAIVEERERIARELHDGLAQVLGYVHTKATAIRLLLSRGQTASAETQLAQLEEAARGLFVDVREAILGLKLGSQRDVRLATLLQEYARHFSALCDLPVEVTIAPSVENATLPPEAEIQLLRIVQEALTNVRKHAQARVARVCVSNGGPAVELSVRDDGRGFDPEQARGFGRPQFGLGTMRERADAIGAEFTIESRPGQGTCVTVRLPIPAAHPAP